MYSNRYVFVIIVEVIILLLLLYIYSYKKTIKEHHTDHSAASNPNVTFYKRNCVVYPVVKKGNGDACAMGTTCGVQGLGCNDCVAATYKNGLTAASPAWAKAAAENGHTLQTSAGEHYAGKAAIAADEETTLALGSGYNRLTFTAPGTVSAVRASLDDDGKVISVDCIPPAPTGEIIHEHFQSYGKNIEFFNNNRIEHFEHIDGSTFNKIVSFFFVVHADKNSDMNSFTVKIRVTPNGPWIIPSLAESTEVTTGSMTTGTLITAMDSMDIGAGTPISDSGDGNDIITIGDIINSSNVALKLHVRASLIEAPNDAGGTISSVHPSYRPLKFKIEIQQSDLVAGAFNINHDSISIIVVPTWKLAQPDATSFFPSRQILALEPENPSELLGTPGGASGQQNLTAFETELKCANDGVGKGWIGGQKCIEHTYTYMIPPDNNSSLTHWDTHINTTSLYHNKDINSHTIGTNVPYMLLNAPSAAAINVLFSTHIDGSAAAASFKEDVANGITKKDGAKAFGNYWKRITGDINAFNTSQRIGDNKFKFFDNLVSDTEVAAKKTAVRSLIYAIKNYLDVERVKPREGRDDNGKIADGVLDILLWFSLPGHMTRMGSIKPTGDNTALAAVKVWGKNSPGGSVHYVLPGKFTTKVEAF